MPLLLYRHESNSAYISMNELWVVNACSFSLNCNKTNPMWEYNNFIFSKHSFKDLKRIEWPVNSVNCFKNSIVDEEDLSVTFIIFTKKLMY